MNTAVNKTEPNAPLGKLIRFEKPLDQYPTDITFAFPYAGLMFLSGIDRPYGSTTVRIKREGSKFQVWVHEPIDTGTTSVTNSIEHIATGLYWTFLRNYDVKNIEWKILYERDPGFIAKEYEHKPTLVWDGTRFHYGQICKEAEEEKPTNRVIDYLTRIFSKS